MSAPETTFTGIGSSGFSPTIPVRDGGVIVRDAAGNETHYTREAWRHEELVERLTRIEEKLDRLLAKEAADG